MNWVATLILLAGVADDFTTRKVHNWLAVVGLAIAFLVSFYFGKLVGLEVSFLGALAAFLIFLPLVLLKALGAGDLKLFVAFGAAVNWNTVLYVAFYSLIWGTVFGLAQIFLRKEGRAFFGNLKTLAVNRKSEGVSLHKIPFTAAMFLGWLSFLRLEGHL
jgi:prepilin peptidase CpaA